jgi:flagellar biosynthesis protein FlhF
MSVQIFRGRTVSEARRAAVARMGAGAVVVTTRTVKKPGVAGWFAGSEVEIAAMAGDDADGAPAERNRSKVVPFAAGVYTVPPATKSPDVSSLRAELKGDIRALKTMLAKADDSSWLSAEIGALRELLEGMSAARPHRDRVVAFLATTGLEGPAATVVARSLKGKSLDYESLRASLPEVLKAGAWPLQNPRTLVALIGPAGVGKTTTAAKLAARARMAKRSVTLVGCDIFRIGAVEQLSRYAELMDVPFVTARNADELHRIIEDARTDVVIVDTAGRHPTADGVEIALAPPADATARPPNRVRHVLLCAPAAIRASDAARLAKRYGNIGPTGLVITKIDETDNPAGLVHAGWAAKLSIAVLCNGPRVPEDIAPATLPVMIDCLAPLAKGQVAA